MSPSSHPPSSSSTAASQIKRSSRFDFTKKRRWGDLVMADMVEDVGFIVNVAMTVLWCGPAIYDVLGWRETDLLDSEVTEYMNEDDQARFRDEFEQAVASNEWFDVQVRMKVDTSKVTWTDLEEVEVALQGCPEQIELEDGGKIPAVFLYGKHRNPTSQYSTVVDLEMERLVLEARLAELREVATPELLAELAAGEGSNSFYTSSNLAARQAEAEEVEPKDEDSPPAEEVNPEASKGSPQTEEEPEDAENARKKKRPKKQHPNEHHVCVACGRTASPEWRKGPQGPKTLCNACGLRWAKQTRTDRQKDDPETQPGKDSTGEDSSAGSTPQSNDSGL